MIKFVDYTPPLIVISFDDGVYTDFTTAYQIMKSKDVPFGTSYIVTSLGPPTYMTWGQMKIMMNDGWDIQCHTHTHQWLTDLTEQEVHQEFQNVDNAFVANKGKPPRHLATPGNRSNALVKSVAEQYRDSMLIAVSDTDNQYETEAMALKKINADIKDQAQMDIVKTAIDDVKNNKGIGIMRSHAVLSSPPGNPYYCLTHYFEEMIDYILSQDIQIVTISDAYKALMRYQNRFIAPIFVQQ